jgi:hypothetical protein
LPAGEETIMRRMSSRPTWLLIAGALASAGAARAESYFKGGKTHFLQSSHHDLGWHKGSYPGERNFTLKEIDVVLDMLRKDPKFKSSGEYTIWLHEYLKHVTGAAQHSRSAPVRSRQ